MTKTTIGRSIIGLLALFFMTTGLMLMFSPASMLLHMYVESANSPGALSSIRSVWGGTIIAILGDSVVGNYKNED